MDQWKRGEKLGHQDGAGVFVGHAQPAGRRAIAQGQALHGVGLPDVVGLLGPLVVFGADTPHASRCQSSLVQPKLQGARGRHQLWGVLFEQSDAQAWRSPAWMLAAQSTTRLLHGQTPGVQRAAAAVEVGQQVRTRRLLLPLPEQTSNRACREGHLQSNLWRTEALLLKSQDALTRFWRCGSRHEERLQGTKR
ncbi:MAG: hypothetical protein JOZ58_21210 [Acetobacteraceae bacterium]|nr:hypothetical protein [Acetobacteraceae bacterium]